MFENIARYTVGIAADENTGIGTGTLVASDCRRYILTAAHVIGNSDPSTLRFWLRPTDGIVEKAAKDTTDQEVGGYTVGQPIPITEVFRNKQTDTALLLISDSYVLPDGSDIYDVSRSHEFIAWPEDKLNDLSLFLFGFPTDNSRLISVVKDRAFQFVGCASLTSEYSTSLNTTAWSRLPSKVSPHKDFVFLYGNYSENIGPRGFSGSGIWIFADDKRRTIWRPDPILIGITHTHFEKAGLLAATKLGSIVESS